MGKALETANKFYEITEMKKGVGLEDVITKDMTFEGPLMKFNGAKEYMESTKQFLQMHRATRIQKQFENGDDMCSIYEMDIATPTGGMLTLEIVDWLHTVNGKVAKQKIFYDPREFAKAFGMG
ncbi:MAG TPA: nuclear transport factor 2 family protein [Nitrososphaera sp.]|nr:nuclear transport factor 2 family protein [Nitrososphaera sp.]